MTTRMRRCPWSGLLLLAWLLAVAPAWAEEFEVTGAGTRLQDDRYLLDARVDYQFSEAALEALSNGVPLYVNVRLQVRRKGAWFWERPALKRRLRYLIRYQPLSASYQVSNLKTDSQQSFATRQAALTALGDLSGLKLLSPADLQSDASYSVRLRATLDIRALPLPMQPLAYLSPSWALSSDWHTWPLEP